VDFVTEAGGRLELFEAKWTELPTVSDTGNLAFVRNILGAAQVTGGAVVCQTSHAFPLATHFRALPVTDV
jgi:hypothetical protein